MGAANHEGSCGMSEIPRDVPGECNAHIYLSQGAGVVTLRCPRLPLHIGLHAVLMERSTGGHCSILWDRDERGAGPGVGLEPVEVAG